MTPAEIAERFILAAGTERKLPRQGERPRGYGGYVLPFIHTFADMNGWRYEPGDRLKPEDRDKHANTRREFWEGRTLRPTVADMAQWEECLRWTAEILADERERRALWAWAFSKVGGMSFSKWCRRVEDIQRQTGQRRTARACERIAAHLERNAVQNIDNGPEAVLQEGPEIGHVSATIAGVYETGRSYAWRSGPAGPPTNDSPLDFSWSEAHNEARRRREARRKAAERKAA